VAEVPRTPDQIFDDSDAMAVSPDLAHVRRPALQFPVLVDPLEPGHLSVRAKRSGVTQTSFFRLQY
jgi:hypothetical protein